MDCRADKLPRSFATSPGDLHSPVQTRLDASRTAPLQNGPVRPSICLADRTAVNEDTGRSPGGAAGSRSQLRRDVCPGFEAGRSDKRCPLLSVRLAGRAVDLVDGNVGEFVAERLFQGSGQRTEQLRVQPDDSLMGDAAAERDSQSRADFDADRLTRFWQSPEFPPSTEVEAQLSLRMFCSTGVQNLRSTCKTCVTLRDRRHSRPEVDPPLRPGRAVGPRPGPPGDPGQDAVRHARRAGHRPTTGSSIATGVIEGARLYQIKDRLDISDARWSVPGAEAVRRFRSMRSSGDFEEYRHFHLRGEWERNHRNLYPEGLQSKAA